MSALDKLNNLQRKLEVLAKCSSSVDDIDGDHRSSVDQIKSISNSISELSKELKEELQYSHQSYRGSMSNLRNANNNIDERERKINQTDDETIAWLDDNYGGAAKKVYVSPKRTPLQRFKICGNLLKTEIRECQKYGLDSKNMKGVGWARMSVAVSSSLTICQMALASPKVYRTLTNCWNLDEFDIFEVEAMPELRGHILVVFASYLSKQFDFLGLYHIPPDKFHNFLMAIEQNYNKVPYHNKIHAADVVHTMMYFCKHSILNKHLSELDNLCAFIAAIIHDVGHTGQTNTFHINSGSVLAIRYNDRSVLEQHHLSLAFQLLKEENNSFLENLTKKENKYVRDTVIEMVLGTDMFYHQKQLKKLKQFTHIMTQQKKLDLQVFNRKNIPRIHGVMNEKLFLMEIALHLSDISNPSKKLSASIEWTKRITNEFMAQGQMEGEQNLPISPGCDTNGNMAKQSVAFIDFIVFPMFREYNTIDTQTNTFIEGIKRSRAHWESRM